MAQARLTALIGAMIVAGACGSGPPTKPSEPTSPAPPAPTPFQASVWKGALDITSCSSSSMFVCTRSSSDNFVLRLATDGTGVIQIDTKILSDATPYAVDVTSQTTGTTTVVTGTSTNPTALDVRLTLTAIGSSLEGTVHYSVRSSDATMVKDGRILFANRDTTVYPARFQGNWVGFVTRTQCTGDCASDYDDVLYRGSVRLALSQAGAAVTGALNQNEVSGTATADQVTASAHRTVPPASCVPQFDSGMDCLIDLTLSASVDSLDRLHGSITYRIEGVDYRGKPFAVSATATLDGLVRWP